MATGSNFVCVHVLPAGNLNELVQHGLCALRETLPAEQDLTTKVSFSHTHIHTHKTSQYRTCCSDAVCVYTFQNVSIGIVGKDLEFTIYDDDDVAPFLEGLEERPQRRVRTITLLFFIIIIIII